MFRSKGAIWIAYAFGMIGKAHLSITSSIDQATIKWAKHSIIEHWIVKELGLKCFSCEWGHMWPQRLCALVPNCQMKYKKIVNPRLAMPLVTDMILMAKSLGDYGDMCARVG